MPDLPDDLDARLRGLGDGRPYVLPGAAAARRRGDQRTRRRRAALSGAGVALVAAVAVTAGLSAGIGGLDRIRTPDVAERPETTPTPQLSPPTAPPPSAEPTPGLDATPVDPGSREPVQALLLDQAAAARAEPGDWMPGPPVQAPLLNPCAGGTDYPRDADRTDTAATSLRIVEEGAGIGIGQTLARYTSAAVAADAAAGYERAVRGCPGTPPDSEVFEPGYQVVRSQQSDTGSTVVFRMSQGFIYASYIAVQQRGDLVSVLAVGYGGDGDPGVEAIEPFLPEVTEALTRD